MNLDKTLCIIYSIPSICVMIFFEKLKINRIFIKYLSASIALLIIGIVVENYQENEQKSFSYFISQIMLSFLISQRILRIPFRKKYHREPILVRSVGTFEDKTYSTILLFVMVSLPFIINSFIIEKLLK
jgi:positive regulator of sigma E activity